MKKIYTLILVITAAVVVRAQSGPQWTGSNFGYNYIFRAIDFPVNQNNTGFACGESVTYQGNGIVVKTTDGGNTWNQVWTGNGMGVEGACFTDLNKGYIAGWPNLGQGWSGFAKTTDGGTTWTSVSVTNDIYFFTDVVFKDFNNGILLGQTNSGAGLWVTNNGGSSWTSATGLVAIPQHACYISGNTYFLVDNDGHIQKSTNNGQTWTTVWDAGASVVMCGIDHYDNNTIMACGDNGLVVVSHDGGANWNYQLVGTDIWHDFAWDSPDHVFMVGTPGLVFQSWDGGTTWQNANPSGAGSSALYECIFTSDYHGFICGSQGVELKRNPGCIAGFTSDITAVCTGKSVAFNSQSYGNISSYNWYFENGTPSSSNDTNPVILYSNPGTFKVKLTVSNPWWTDSIVKQNYVTAVQSPEAPVITANGAVLSSNIASGNQWYFDGNLIPGATGQTWEAVATGTYWDEIISGNCSSDTSNNIYIVLDGVQSYVSDKPVISPVPNHGRFNLTLPGNISGSAEISIYNTDGKLIFQKHITASQKNIMIDLGNIPGGLYAVSVSGGDRVYKVIMEVD